MFSFKRNMSIVDRLVRITVGSSLLVIGPLTDVIKTDLLSNIILGVLGSTALLSGLFAYCVLYELTGFDTLGKKESD